MAETKKSQPKTKKLTSKEETLKKEIIGKVNRHFGKALDEATTLDERITEVLSTKGSL